MSPWSAQAIVVPIVNIKRLEFGQQPKPGGRAFRRLIWGDVVLSLLNKIYINSRHDGGVING